MTTERAVLVLLKGFAIDTFTGTHSVRHAPRTLNQA